MWVGSAVTQHAQLPPIDRGLRDGDVARPPRSDEHGIIGAGEPLLHGSLIVKFRPGTSLDAQRFLLAQVDGSGAETPSYADFDIVSIDPGADPEAMTRRLEAQPDVEYAQPRYRVYPRFVPNDPLYTRQWNYQRDMLDMERAWDINPGATPSITVAVLDSGVAFRSMVVRYNAAFPFRLVQNGPVFPALGLVDSHLRTG